MYYLEIKDAYKQSVNLIKSVFSFKFDIPERDITIHYDNYGKPSLSGFRNLHFNVSHTEGLIVCAVSDRIVGVDVEKIKTLNNKLVQRFYRKKEQDYVYGNTDNQALRFIEVWTKKEAFVKWTGKGIMIPFESIDVLDNHQIFTVKMDGHVLSVCSSCDIDMSDIELIDMKKYYQIDDEVKWKK